MRDQQKAIVKHDVTGWIVVLAYRGLRSWITYHSARFTKRQHVQSYLDRLRFDVIDGVL